MAKGKGKGSSGATAAIPDGGVSVDKPNNASTDSGPQLEEGAFAGLRQKIEQKLKDQSAAKEQKAKNKTKGAAKDTSKNDNKETTKPNSTQESKSNNKKDRNNKGKKRDRNGDVIASEGKPSGKEKPSKSTDGDENDALRKEILALGGTEDDLDLVAGIGSESEVEDSADAKKKSSNKSGDEDLRKELSSMLAAAGQVVPDDIEDEEEEEAEDQDDNDEGGDDESDEQEDIAAQEGSDIEEESSSEPFKEKNKKELAKREEFVVPKEYSKLVRIFPMPMLQY